MSEIQKCVTVWKINEAWASGETSQCFRRATYHMCIFNMACAGACECDHTPIPFINQK